MSEVRYSFESSTKTATISIDTPGPVNTIGSGFLDGLERSLALARKDRAMGIKLVSGKRKSFLDGANLLEIRKNLTEGTLRALVCRLSGCMRELAVMPAQVVAVLDGQTARGGG